MDKLIPLRNKYLAFIFLFIYSNVALCNSDRQDLKVSDNHHSIKILLDSSKSNLFANNDKSYEYLKIAMNRLDDSLALVNIDILKFLKFKLI